MKSRKNFVLVIFGASGSLAKHKIFPAIYKMIKREYEAKQYMVLGFARTHKTDEEFREEFRESLDLSETDNIQGVLKNIFYCSGDYSNKQDYKKLKKIIDGYEKNHFGANTKSVRCFYLAIPPVVFEQVVENIGLSGLKEDRAHIENRLIIEKPFGRDLVTAKALETVLMNYFKESEVYRIDHYLGKETVQNLLIFRFVNKFIEPLFNSRYISNVQITSAESVGVENRAGYFDHAGIVRDMIQPHVLQMLSLIAMERPTSFSAKAIKDEKVKVLNLIRPVSMNNDTINIVRAQYTSGVIRGHKVRSYREEEGIGVNSQTETYAALKFYIDNDRWFGIPFFVRAGKRMSKKSTVINIQFKDLPALQTFSKCTPIPSNILTIKIQPEESIFIKMFTKKSGTDFDIKPSQLTFFQSCDDCLDAYSRLINDALIGDNTLFIRYDEIDIAWQIVDPILLSFEKEKLPRLDYYASGSDGPARADIMLREAGYSWIDY